jgi:hypothetical protein
MNPFLWLKDAAALLPYRFQTRKMAETIRLSPVKYEGLYEPVHRLCGRQKSAARALAEWKVRTCHLYPDSVLARFFARFSTAPIMQKHPDWVALVLMRGILSAGVTRDEAQKLTADPLRASAYRALDGTAIEEGALLRVISPAWYCNGFVVEHGIAEVLE